MLQSTHRRISMCMRLDLILAEYTCSFGLRLFEDHFTPIVNSFVRPYFIWNDYRWLSLKLFTLKSYRAEHSQSVRRQSTSLFDRYRSLYANDLDVVGTLFNLIRDEESNRWLIELRDWCDGILYVHRITTTRKITSFPSSCFTNPRLVRRHSMVNDWRSAGIGFSSETLRRQTITKSPRGNVSWRVTKDSERERKRRVRALAIRSNQFGCHSSLQSTQFQCGECRYWDRHRNRTSVRRDNLDQCPRSSRRVNRASLSGKTRERKGDLLEEKLSTQHNWHCFGWI